MGKAIVTVGNHRVDILSPWIRLIIDPSPLAAAGRLLIEQCRAASPETRIVVLASLPTPSLRARVAQLQIEVYLEKPATPGILFEQLRSVLGQASLERLAASHPTAAQQGQRQRSHPAEPRAAPRGNGCRLTTKREGTFPIGKAWLDRLRTSTNDYRGQGA